MGFFWIKNHDRNSTVGTDYPYSTLVLQIRTTTSIFLTSTLSLAKERERDGMERRRNDKKQWKAMEGKEGEEEVVETTKRQSSTTTDLIPSPPDRQ